MTGAQPEVTFKPPKGGKFMLLDNMKYERKKKDDESQCSIYQAYEVLHEYI